MSTPFSLHVAEAFSVRDQVVVVTGAAGRIGSVIAEAFAVNAARVIASDRAGEDLSGVVRHLTDQHLPVREQPADLTNPEDLKALVSAARRQFGRLDALINCGGIPSSREIAYETEEDFDRLYHTNVRSIWLLTRYAADLMTENGGGSIVNIASVNGHRPEMFASLYCGSKAAVLSMTCELAVELAPRKIRINSVSPGSIPAAGARLRRIAACLHEPYARQFLDRFLPQSDQVGVDSQPLPLTGHPADVAMACIYLCSPAARFITAADVLVDGGALHKIPACEPRFQNRRERRWPRVREFLDALPDAAWKAEKPQWLWARKAR